MNKHEQATELIEKICEDYGITMKDLKKKKSGFPNRSVSRKGKDVSLASIRQALSYFIFILPQIIKIFYYPICFVPTIYPCCPSPRTRT